MGSLSSLLVLCLIYTTAVLSTSPPRPNYSLNVNTLNYPAQKRLHLPSRVSHQRAIRRRIQHPPRPHLRKEVHLAAEVGGDALIKYNPRGSECTKSPRDLRYLADYPTETLTLYHGRVPIARYSPQTRTDKYNRRTKGVQVLTNKYHHRIEKVHQGLLVRNLHPDEGGEYRLECQVTVYIHGKFSSNKRYSTINRVELGRGRGKRVDSIAPKEAVLFAAVPGEDALIEYHPTKGECTKSRQELRYIADYPSQTMVLHKDGRKIAEYHTKAGKLEVLDPKFKGRIEKTASGLKIKRLKEAEAGEYTLECISVAHIPGRGTSRNSYTTLNRISFGPESTNPSSAVVRISANAGRNVLIKYNSKHGECEKSPEELRYIADYPTETLSLMRNGRKMAVYEPLSGKFPTLKRILSGRIEKVANGVKLKNVTKKEAGEYMLECRVDVGWPPQAVGTTIYRTVNRVLVN